MNNQSPEQLIQILIMILIPVIMAIFGLIIFLIFSYYKEKSKNSLKNTKETSEIKEKKDTQLRQSIFNFMEFDKIEDNMIILKNETKYLMVIGCQGLNYDLMSGVEKNSVEEGFVQFLNSLRMPIQIYIQTRAVNLENNIATYQEKIKEIEQKYNNMKFKFEQMLDSDEYSDEEIAKAQFELTKQSNLYEYGVSIIKDTQRMSLNKNILNKSYYIIVPYYISEAGNDKLDKAEIKNIAFSELYTRAQSIVSSISACGVRGKILRTNELIELLYMAYNREEAESFGVEKALKAGFNELYSTAPDVYEKRMKEIDRMIEEKARIKAKEKVKEAKSEIQKILEEKESNIDYIIDDIAKMIIEENEQYIGTEVKEKAIEKIENEREGGQTNGKKTRRTRKKTI